MKLTQVGWLILGILVAVLSSVLPIFLNLVDSTLLVEPAMLFALVLVAIAGWNIALVVARGKARLVNLTFWVYVYLWGALAPLAQMTEGTFYWSGSYTPHDWMQGMAITALGTAGWWVGYRWRDRQPHSSPRYQLSRRRVRGLGLVALALAAYGVFLLGADAFFTSRATLVRATASAVSGDGHAGTQALRALIGVPAPTALALFLWGRSRLGWRLAGGDRLLTAALLVATIVVANPVANARFWAASVAIAILLAGTRLDTRERVRSYAGALIIGLLLVFPIADAFRHEGVERTFDVKFTQEAMTHGDYDAFQQTMNGVEYTRLEGHSFGRQLLGPFQFFVPRQVWSAKPEASGKMIAERLGYRFTNLSSPAWLDGYLDFGWPGAAMVGLILGAIAAAMDGALVRAETGLLAMIAPLYVGYQVVLLRGSLLAVVASLVIWVALCWFCSVRVPTVSYHRLHQIREAS